ncbi:hypothetical protein FH972_005085 [Carpinus fangiana]|uniref:Uncharacterized protein n=1 Tax=Carpinus fangiana TaxID=176857 RepID=A0A5N6QPZ6_9ROSI|nr:hypothetical protein FH972_005085 [Carpinus fangiana]
MELRNVPRAASSVELPQPIPAMEMRLSKGFEDAALNWAGPIEKMQDGLVMNSPRSEPGG